MENCVACGRELPPFSPHSRCDDCRAAAPEFSPAAPARARLAAHRQWPITSILVGLNVLVFAAMVLTGVSPMQPTSQQLLRWGANWGPLSLGSEPWRMLASNYLHIGIFHIGLNMWCLWSLGRLAERIFVPWTYVLLYTCCGLAGSLGSLWWHPLVIGAGASGAIFGLAGGLLAALYLGRLPIPKEALRGTMKSLLTFTGYNLFFGAIGAGIDNSAHIGGLLAGLALGAMLATTYRGESREWWRRAAFAAMAMVLVVAFAAVKRSNGYVVPLQQGADALQKGRFDEAARALEQVVAKRPQDTFALTLLGSAYLEKQDYAKAEGVLQRALQGHSDAGTLYNLGLAELRLGKPAQAVLSLQRALQLDPNYADAEQALGEAYAAANSPAQAAIAFKHAEELRKNRPSQ